MYTVYCDDQLLYDPRVEELTLEDPKIALEVNKTGAFDFVIYPTHPLYTSIKRLKSVIEVYQRTRLVFRGRVLNDEIGLYKEKKVICEGDLAYFNDSIQRPYEHAGSVADYLSMLLAAHNAQVEPNKRFVLGNVTVMDGNDYIVRADSTYPNTWEVLNSKLLELLGGYLIVRRESGINYLDYLADSPYTTLQTIELGTNLLDFMREQKGEDIATAIIPIGAKLSDVDGNEQRLDIKSVNNGLDYVHDQDAVNEYGWIFKTVEYNDVTLPENLLTKGQEALAEATQTSVNLELKAVDLSMEDVSIDEFKLFEYVTVTSLPHDINASYLVKQMTLDLDKPENNSITIGSSYRTFVGQKISTDSAVKSIKSDYATNTKLNEVSKSVDEVSLNVTQVTQEIETSVAATYATKDELESFSTTAAGTYATKNEVSTLETNVDDTYSTKAELETYKTEVAASLTQVNDELQEVDDHIAFVNGNIELGHMNNPLRLVIESNAVVVKMNGVAVVTIDDQGNITTSGSVTATGGHL
ncbi:phage tail spike protein [Exiguobacterium aestuarii]|uniref:Phage tail spike protein n=1 Tax=Exiguobacterium aestuarii TaxID=273527 RepID=A0ABW2PIF3_9BACL|nr:MULTISPECIES: phage tail spike protein [Exiguobacterium]MCT4787451.1 phage tail protein [Exiguobacterium aestuarii]